MRRKREAVLPFEWNNDHLPKTVREYRQKYKGISQLLDANPGILDRVHKDLKKLSQGGRSGRDADSTSETILRALVVHAIQGLALRETVILMAGSDFLQDFLRRRKKAVMDFTFLDKCLLAIRPQMWRRVNEGRRYLGGSGIPTVSGADRVHSPYNRQARTLAGQVTPPRERTPDRASPNSDSKDVGRCASRTAWGPGLPGHSTHPFGLILNTVTFRPAIPDLHLRNRKVGGLKPIWRRSWIISVETSCGTSTAWTLTNGHWCCSV